ncbi:hypothetical protein CLOBL_09490 [Clostridium sp. BL-8]|nr:hypothetical protein CLOBL_09490 [Clostridium sp. BL-8]
MIINIFKLLYINNDYTTYRIKRKLDSIFNLVVLFDAYNKNINNLIINIGKACDKFKCNRYPNV